MPLANVFFFIVISDKGKIIKVSTSIEIFPEHEKYFDTYLCRCQINWRALGVSGLTLLFLEANLTSVVWT